MNDSSIGRVLVDSLTATTTEDVDELFRRDIRSPVCSCYDGRRGAVI